MSVACSQQLYHLAYDTDISYRPSKFRGQGINLNTTPKYYGEHLAPRQDSGYLCA